MMYRITPANKYRDIPCSFVAIGCAFDFFNRSEELSIPVNENGYATLDAVNRQIRKVFNVKKYLYFKKEERYTLESVSRELVGCGVVCVLGHFIFVDFDRQEYYSFFENSLDKVVAIWLLK